MPNMQIIDELDRCNNTFAKTGAEVGRLKTV
jgi:hypothetical protein